MQYGFVLPADYDMAIIRRRIAERGASTDGFPGLGFKAYLWAERGDRLPSRDHLYAPFYLWRDHAGMNAFLGGPGFAGVVQSFGRPAVRIWSVWRAEVSQHVEQAVCASREIGTIDSAADLGAWHAREQEAALEAVSQGGALAAVAAFEPATWTYLRFRLWAEPRAELAREDRQLYEVGHVSLGS